MPALSANPPSSTTTSSKPDGADYEPDEDWKLQLRKRIEEGLQSMVADAKRNHATESRKAPDTAETRIRLEASYKEAMQTIKNLATEQYQLELDRERNQRRWTAGVPMSPGWTQFFHEEQQNIMNSIKQSSNHTDNPGRSASESPTEERRSAIPKPSNEPPASLPPPPLLPVPPNPSPRPTEEREKSFISPPSVRRGSDARSTLSRDHDDHSGSFRRGHRGSVHERGAIPDWGTATDAVEEPDEILRLPPARNRMPSIDRPSQHSQPSPISPDRWDSSLGRSSGSIHSTVARSPPKPPPEVWKPAISPAEDALPPKTYNLGRRGSAASMRSTGSGTSMRSAGSGTSTSIRPSITETIPERADDGPDGSALEERDYEKSPDTTEQNRTWISLDKSREKEKRPRRRDSRPSPIDGSFRSDEPLGSSGLRSASSSTMQYAISPQTNGPIISAKPSLLSMNDDRHHPSDSSGKPPPYYEYRNQSSPRDSYPYRDQQVPSQDLPPARPIPTRSPYVGDDRDYATPYSPLHRPHGPKPPYHHPRESRPISRQASFTRQPYVNDDDDDDERDRRDLWDREYDRDRDREGGRDPYSDPRRPHPYPSQRHPPYPNPPPSASRHGPQEYTHLDFYDDRPEGAAGLNRRYNYRDLPPDDWDYQRPESARPTPSRQPSYIRPRDDLDRRFTGESGLSISSERKKHTLLIDVSLLDYSRLYAPGGGIPIPRHTPSLEEPPIQPAWSNWAAEGNRHPNYDYPQQARSPPTAESFTHRRFAHPPPPPSYNGSPHDDHPSFGGRETDSSHRDNNNKNNNKAADEYDSDEDSEEEEEEDSSEEGVEAKRIRDLEAKRQKLEEERREADDELKRTMLELEQLASEDTRKKREEEEKRIEEARREEEKRNEEARREEEARKREEEARKKEEEVRRKEEEVKRKEEETAKKAEEAKKMEEDAKKKEEEAKKKEREARKKELDAKRKEEAAKRHEEEAKRKAEELSRKEEETKQRAAQLEEDTERTKQMQLEAQKIAEDALKKQEDLRRMAEEAHKKDVEMKAREDILRRREEELMRREADNFRREQEARKKEEEARVKDAANKKEEIRKEEARKKEELKREEARKKEDAKRREDAKKEAARREEARREEARREEARREEEARQEEARQEVARQEAAKQEAARQEEELIKEEARKREEAKQKQLDEEAKKKVAEAKKVEDNLKRKLQAEDAKRKLDEAAREEAKLEDFRREQEEKRQQNESQHFDDLLLDLDDPKLLEEQVKLLQQAGFRKREEDIRRTREERKRNDSVGNDNAWSIPSYLSSSPGTSSNMSRTPPQFNGPPIPERSVNPPSWSTAPTPAWGPSIKPTASPSPAASRSSASASTGKPRTGSVSSGTYPMSSSPHTTAFSEAERTRKQQEFAESQQEQFRRTQEKLEAERQLRSAGRPLSRDELQRVFELHERLWNRLNTLSELTWNDFPWPMARPPSSPDDMSLPLIGAYIQSPVYPDKDKSRTPKDRIKEHIKRWHPDRFETKLLPKVVEDEREKVKHGAGNVARYLSDLLRKENESNNNIFGD